jgi:hypothetical protein
VSDGRDTVDKIVELLTRLLALGSGVVAVVVIAGGAVLGLRLHRLNVPSEAVLGDLPKQLLITTGLTEVVLPTTVAALLSFLLLTQQDGAAGLLKRTLTTFIGGDRRQPDVADDRQSPERPGAVTDSESEGLPESEPAPSPPPQATAAQEGQLGVHKALRNFQSLVGLIGCAGIVLLPVNLIQWTDSVLVAAVYAAVGFVALFCWLVRNQVRALGAPQLIVAPVICTVLVLTPFVYYWDKHWMHHALWFVAICGLLAILSAIGFVVFGTVIGRDHKHDRRTRLNAFLAASLLSTLTIAPWFVDYARERPLLPVTICLASGEQLRGTSVGQTPNRIYFADQAREALESVSLDSTTEVIVSKDPLQQRSFQCPLATNSSP